MNRKIDWAKAATNGLFLSLIAIGIDYIQMIFQIEGFIATILKALKIGGTTALLHYYIKKNFIETGSELTYGGSFRYGMAVSLFSTVVCTLATLILYQVILPDAIESQVLQMLSIYEEMGMSEFVDYDILMKTMPVIMTIGQIINCLIWGLILSSILANKAKVKKDNPFQ